jgi:hypothetical protein
MKRIVQGLIIVVVLTLGGCDVYYKGERIWRSPLGLAADALQERREQRRGWPWE